MAAATLIDVKPLIGITVDAKPDPSDAVTKGKLELNWNYAQAVADAGGIPLLIPPQADMRALAEVLHGWLIPGGLDIDARHFGETNHQAVRTIADERFEGERRLFEALAPDIPVLGVCYGCQFLNVVRGGSLVQHLPEVVSHEEHSGGTAQAYRLKDGSKLQALVGGEVARGKSYHHQGVKRVGEGLQVVAEHEDGTVEAVEATDRPWMIGVQWHPERTPDDPASQRLFASFVAAAREYAARTMAARR